MSPKTITIADRIIGDGMPCFIIGEIGANHNQQFDIAKQLIDVAVDAGVDVVKFQSFKVEQWLSKDFVEFPTMSEAEDLHAELKRAELPYEMFARIIEYCHQKSIICFSTPSNIVDVDKLHELNVPAFKFGSVQITDLPTIAHASRFGLPVILSGGAANMSDILSAVETVLETGNDQLVVLHCTSVYPCHDYSLLNLNVLRSFQAMFDFPVGYSDHTTDPIIAPVAAVAMGAKILEKHFTLDRSMKGPDHSFALEPDELKCMVSAIRKTERSMGSAHRRMLPEEVEVARLGRRSLVATRDIKVGGRISAADLAIKRPGTGIEPRYLDLIIGRTARMDISADHVLTWDMV
ncbi:N-acetylneuraminate synthase family protein [Chloroflexota bacterium]